MSARSPDPKRSPSAWSRLRGLLRSDARTETEEELGFHLEMRVRDYVRAGMSDEEARMAARQRFGDVERIRREVGEIADVEARAERRREWLSDLGQDIRYGVRTLLRAPVFTGTTAVTLALGIGATTAIFSLVWAVLLAPLPYAEPDRLVRIWETSPQGSTRNVVSAGNVSDWQQRARSFVTLGAHSFPAPVTLTGDGEAVRVSRVTIQPEALAALGVAPMIGRALAEEDEDGGRVVLISHAFWQSRYGGDPTALGRTLVLDDVVHTVVGVMPPGFSFPSEGVDAWRSFTPANFDRNERTSHNHQVLARLAPGVSVETAQAEMVRIAEGIAGEHPREMTGWSARVVPLHADVTRNVASLFWVLLGGVGVVLLITCGNVANLLLARAVGRRREMALRGALGAGRERILRQLLTEGGLVTLLGAVGAVLLAPVILRSLVQAAPADVPLLDRAVIDSRMLAFTAATALSCALLFGLAPALRLTRLDLESTLRAGRDAAHGGHLRIRGALLAGQVALSVVLLVGAGLFVRSYRALQATELGFDPERLVLMDVVLPLPRYPEIADQISLYDRLQERLATLPGVAAVAGSSQPPGSASMMTFSFAIEGRIATNPTGREDDETLHAVLPGYFETIGQRISSGRSFTGADRSDAPPVAILNETLAHKHFPEGDAVGHRVSFRPGETPWLEIVGVVTDARLESPDVAPREGIFIPFAQKTWPWLTSLTLVVRAAPNGDPIALAEGLRDALLEIDPEVPPLGIRTVHEAFRSNTARRAFAMTLVTGFGLLALVLSVVGLYGLITYSVARERREIGVRLALGARSGDVVSRVLRRSLVLTGIGAVAGLVGAWAVSRVIGSLLYGVSPTDATTYALTAGLVLVVALVTAAVPALSAARTDPILAMRAD